MRNRILSLLLAVCLVAVLMPVVTTAAPGSATLVMRSNDENLSLTVERGKTVYAVTTDRGIVTQTGATAKNYNIKFSYPTRGKPTLSLKNANIVNKAGNGIATLAAAEAFSLDIVVEADSAITAGYSGIVFGNGDLTVKGKGTLKITAGGTGVSVNSATAVGNFVMEGAKLDITATTGFAAVQVSGGDGYVKGGELKLLSESGNAIEVFRFYRTGTGENLAEYKLPDWETRGNLLISGGTVSATSNSAGNGLRAEGNITLGGGTVDVTGADRAVWTESALQITGGDITLDGKHKTREAVAVGSEFSITGGTVEISSVRAAFAENAVPNMAGHKGYSAVAGITLADAGVFNREQAAKYRYFKLTDGDTVDATEETTEATEETTEATEETTEATEETTEATQESTEATTEETETTGVTEATGVTETTGATEESTGETTPLTEPAHGDGAEKTVDVKLIVAFVLLAVLVGAEVAVLLILRKRRQNTEI